MLLAILDAVVFFGALTLALFIRYGGGSDWPLVKNHFLPFSIIFGVWLFLLGAFGLYDLHFMKNDKRFFYRLIRAMATNTVVSILIFYFIIPIFEIEPRRNLFLVAIFTTIFVSILRYLFNLLIIKAPSSRVLFFGITKEAVELADYLLKNPQLGNRPAAFLSSNGSGIQMELNLPHFTSTGDLPHVVGDFKIDTIIVLREIKEDQMLVNALFKVIPAGVGIIEFTAFHEMLTGKIPHSLIGEVWFLENLFGVKKTVYDFFKRGMDILLTLAAGIPAAFIFPFVALAIKIDSKGSVFYQQKRVGKHGKEFRVIKYRTMIKDADKMSGWKGDGIDPRHTRVGRFLRKSYLDELPQIVNIFRGQMSFVGPRPERPGYVKELKEKIPFYEMRLLVSPGITGWAQIHMENDASVEDAPAKMQ